MPDYEQLLAEVYTGVDDSRQIDVLVLDAERSGIEQISDALLAYRDLDAIHLLTHGQEAAIVVVGDVIDLERLQSDSASFAGWGGALNANGDILVYGCDVASTVDGQQLIDSLAAITRADVAASDDLTGNAEQGADWDLEYRAGDVEASLAVTASAQSD